jgi:hypothetical protein
MGCVNISVVADRAMASRTPSIRSICLVLIISLSTALVVASSSAPPALDVEACLSVETGIPVCVMGILVDMQSYDSGTEVLTLLDRDGGASLRVVCPSSPSVRLCMTLRLGDLVRVEGEVSRDASDTIIYASKDRVSQVLRPEFVLSVELLCENWRMFEFDRFNISGEVMSDGESLRMRGFSSSHTILLRFYDGEPPPTPGQVVIADCTLLVDQHSMVIFLKAHGFRTDF